MKGTVNMDKNIKVPTVLNLRKFSLNTSKGSLNFVSVCRVVEKMTFLEELSLSGLSEEDELKFAIWLIVAHMNANKQVLVNNAKCQKFLFRRILQSADASDEDVSMFNFNIATENIDAFINQVYGAVSKSVSECVFWEIE